MVLANFGPRQAVNHETAFVTWYTADYSDIPRWLMTGKSSNVDLPFDPDFRTWPYIEISCSMILSQTRLPTSSVWLPYTEILINLIHDFKRPCLQFRTDLHRSLVTLDGSIDVWNPYVTLHKSKETFWGEKIITSGHGLDRDHSKPPTLSYFWVHFGSNIFCILFSVLALVHPKMGLFWYQENQKRLKWKTLQ